jgi:putative MFS transporter
VSLGHSFTWTSKLLAASAFLTLPTVLVAAWLYGRWTSKGALLGALAVAAAGLAGMLFVERSGGGASAWLACTTLLVIGSNAILAMLLPYAAESYPAATRARAVGWIAACSKIGGPVAQGLTLLGLVPALGAAAIVTAGTTVAALGLIGSFCVETRNRELH